MSFKIFTGLSNVISRFGNLKYEVLTSKNPLCSLLWLVEKYAENTINIKLNQEENQFLQNTPISEK